MQIVSPTGAALSLAIVGYESDANTGPRPEDDWLVIAGEVRLPGGRAWTFRDPCLRVVEAEL